MINDHRKYCDTDGNLIALYRLVRKEPEWAETVITYYEKVSEKLESENQKMRIEIKKLLRHARSTNNPMALNLTNLLDDLKEKE